MSLIQKLSSGALIEVLPTRTKKISREKKKHTLTCIRDAANDFNREYAEILHSILRLPPSMKKYEHRKMTRREEKIFCSLCPRDDVLLCPLLYAQKSK